MYDIYSNDHSDKWRYTLGKAGRAPILTIGLNPSTATQEKADTTVAKVEQVALNNGYDGFVMLNLYPIRATDYRELSPTVNETAFAKNLDAIEEMVSAQSKPVIWAAWGTSVEYHSYFSEARDQLHDRLAKYKAKWLHFGDLTAEGHPRHPSRLSYGWQFSPYKAVV
jgi:hypothetical protein